jgi:hypothetical protein
VSNTCPDSTASSASPPAQRQHAFTVSGPFGDGRPLLLALVLQFRGDRRTQSRGCQGRAPSNPARDLPARRGQPVAAAASPRKTTAARCPMLPGPCDSRRARSTARVLAPWFSRGRGCFRWLPGWRGRQAGRG